MANDMEDRDSLDDDTMDEAPKRKATTSRAKAKAPAPKKAAAGRKKIVVSSICIEEKVMLMFTVCLSVEGSRRRYGGRGGR